MNEFDKNQLKLMIQKINLFKNNQLYLSDLIYDLEALLNILETNDLNWKEKFRMYWADLEITYAMTLSDNKMHLEPEDQRIINESIESLINLIKSKL